MPEKKDDPAVEPEAAANAKADADRVVELADKYTGFFDNATGFQIVRDQQKRIGKTVGEATQVALESGRLLFVVRK